MKMPKYLGFTMVSFTSNMSLNDREM